MNFFGGIFTGQATGISIEISKSNDSAKVSAGVLNAQLDEKLTITCSYSGTPTFDDYYFLRYRASSTDGFKKVFTRGSVSHPWSEEPQMYAGISDYNARPFTLIFNIESEYSISWNLSPSI